MNQKNLAIGVDLGGTHSYAAVVDTEGKVLVMKETDIDLSLSSEEIIRKLIIPTIKAAMEENPFLTDNIKAVGMGLPGSIDFNRGVCLFSPNFRWKNVDVVTPIYETLGIPVYIMNDVRSAALGEKHFGAGRGVKNFVMCAIGTGIGGGVVANGELLLGEMGVAGEIGHITVDPNGYRCNCGNKGCLEALASGPNIARRGREAMTDNKNSILWQMVEDPSKVSAATLYKAAAKGDETALKVWEDTGRYLGIGFSAIIHTVNPRRFIVGGRVANALEFFLPALQKELEERARMVTPGSVEIVPAGLKEGAGMIGSAAVAFERTGIF